MLIIGLTGGIASGKSEVAKIFQQHNFYVISSDPIGHELLFNKDVKNKLIEAFGSEILSDGEIDRNKLGNIVFTNPDQRKKINEIIHPLVIAEITERIQHAKQGGFHTVIIESALILEEEEQLPSWMHALILVRSPEQTRIKRLMENRGLTYDDALNRIKSQKDPEKKRKLAQWIITNDGDLKSLEQQVISIIEELKHTKFNDCRFKI